MFQDRGYIDREQALETARNILEGDISVPYTSPISDQVRPVLGEALHSLSCALASLNAQERVSAWRVARNDRLMQFVPAQALSFVRFALNKDRRLRPTAEDLLLHPWIQDHACG